MTQIVVNTDHQKHSLMKSTCLGTSYIFIDRTWGRRTVVTGTGFHLRRWESLGVRGNLPLIRNKRRRLCSLRITGFHKFPRVVCLYTVTLRQGPIFLNIWWNIIKDVKFTLINNFYKDIGKEHMFHNSFVISSCEKYSLWLGSRVD